MQKEVKDVITLGKCCYICDFLRFKHSIINDTRYWCRKTGLDIFRLPYWSGKDCPYFVVNKMLPQEEVKE